MTKQSAKPQQDEPPLWQYIPLHNYKVPTAPIEAAVKTGLAGLWHRLRPTSKEDGKPFKAKDELRALSEEQIDEVAPPPDWQNAADAFDKVIQSHLTETDGNHPPAIWLVGPPHSSHAQILSIWAKRQGWRIIKPPSPEKILTQDESWLDQFLDNETPWVLPRMERCYLRHAGGLGLLRRFFERLWAGHPAPGVIGCNSWAWHFWNFMWQVQPQPVFTSQAFDQERLMRWFQTLPKNSDGRNFRFRQSDNGKDIIPPPVDAADTKNKDTSPEISDFLQQLSTYSRGIPDVAWAQWRRSLLNVPDETLEDEAVDQDSSSRQTKIWVHPWSQHEQPTLPANAGREQAFVAHALLLHGGLSAGTLLHLLPLSQGEINLIIHNFAEAGLLRPEAECWEVTALGYPAVRQFLADEGYLVDDF